jgi:predicted transcriptional regulator
VRFESEVISEKLLPAVRSIIAGKLRADYGLKQTEIARKLGITQAAVSNYLNNGRADQEIMKNLKDDPQISILLDEAAGKAAKGEDFGEEMSDVLRNVRDKGLMKEYFNEAKKL